MGVTAILLAAGRGERFGGDKTQLVVRGRPLWRYAYDTFRSIPEITEIGIVTHPDRVDAFRDMAQDADFVVAGGSTRGESARRGVEASTQELVLLHDAARPFVSAEVIGRVIEGLQTADAVAACIPVVDTIKQVVGLDVATLDRSRLVAMQTPQGSRRNLLLKAYDEVSQEFTDEMALLEQIGIRPHLVAGDPANFKVTTPDDLLRTAGFLGAPETRTGLGYDIHPFADDDRPMMLGGVRFDGPGLSGHSDADVLLHAVTDSILGAVGLGDIGLHFPNTDPRWRGEASSVFLSHAAQLVREAGWEIVHLDATVIAEQPKIMIKANAIRESIANSVGISADRVSVKATTNEKLGALGRSEGIAAFAVATVRQMP